MINYLTAKKIIKKNVVLVFDGFMILKEDLKNPINDLRSQSGLKKLPILGSTSI